MFVGRWCFFMYNGYVIEFLGKRLFIGDVMCLMFVNWFFFLYVGNFFSVFEYVLYNLRRVFCYSCVFYK